MTSVVQERSATEFDEPVKAHVAKGLSDREAGNAIGISKYAVRRIRNRLGIPPGSPERWNVPTKQICDGLWTGRADEQLIAEHYAGRRYGR